MDNSFTRWLGKWFARLLPRVVVRGAVLRMWEEVKPCKDMEEEVHFLDVTRAYRLKRGVTGPSYGVASCPWCDKEVWSEHGNPIKKREEDNNAFEE